MGTSKDTCTFYVSDRCETIQRFGLVGNAFNSKG